ncbi:hypothetical protein AA101099_1801 [Neoasaia chiangmaiensis NBRC 101099]|uniref:Uncharacterized protein n=1 Tax=Neoasaia chiangmaiensis TaxID=320497 RepID=A0A1U9KR88_9PROT|nr:hypothetical protein [Neoasaia chiangmaiensis]AQS88242.1 hypothetical protein A0U93_10165 [Neoasaia chiangmaiensis]GBR39752.1 hypothetical protein AA101099_1801 [Neoasaia chiangmaiensis NBRC 101099]GEN14724.1 hypothetical protein NCH01_11550 [Neoasaia chiangmaiensis]
MPSGAAPQSVFRTPPQIVAKAESLIAQSILLPWNALMFADWLDELADMAVCAGFSQADVAETRALADRVRSRAPCRQIASPILVVDNVAQRSASGDALS